MSRPRRKPPTLRQKLAAALLTMVRPDANGTLVPIIPYAEARQLTAEQILSRFEWDHAVYVAWSGSNHPTNLTPRLKAAHREKTKRDAKAIAKVRRAEKRRALAVPCCGTNDDGLPKCDGSCLTARERAKAGIRDPGRSRGQPKRKRQQADADRERLTEFFEACKPRRPIRRTKRPMQYTAMKATHKRTFAGKVVPR